MDASFDPQPSLQQKQWPQGIKAVEAMISMHTWHSIPSCTSRTCSATRVILWCSAANSLPYLNPKPLPYPDAWPERERSCRPRSCRASSICAREHRGLLEFFALHFDDGGKPVLVRLQHCLALLTLSCVFVFASPSAFSKSSAHQGQSYSSRERRHAHLFWRARKYSRWRTSSFASRSSNALSLSSSVRVCSSSCC